ncbi:hypothetical protein CEE69_30980 [Rhodopirellula bahusiensis]|uniref:SecDF P1 head subdomain domain-containing protein n=2 Tax=Rhodopirellula bahusiensis TaxID=2014065 RepID=A0A2G1VXC6_9BACT|nr:hypothetical protein CEE69_30980 [Rhodopirellula bahusiensis]
MTFMTNQSGLLQDDFESRNTSRNLFRGFVIAAGVFLLVAVITAIAFVFLYQPIVPATQLVYAIQRLDSQSEIVTSSEMVEPLTRRLRHFFGPGMQVNALDEAHVEVILPTQDPMDLAVAKDLLVSAGVLRFLPIADRDQNISLSKRVEQAGDPPSLSRDVLNTDGTIVGRWVTVGFDDTAMLNDRITSLNVDLRSPIVRDSETGEVLSLPNQVLGNDNKIKIAQWMQEQAIRSIDVLTLVEETQAVNGEDLAFAAVTFDERGDPAVAFTFNDAGSKKMEALTITHSPKGNSLTQLGVVLDDQLITPHYSPRTC